MLLLGEQDFAASNHDSFDANSLVMVTLRQATSPATRSTQFSTQSICKRASKEEEAEWRVEMRCTSGCADLLRDEKPADYLTSPTRVTVRFALRWETAARDSEPALIQPLPPAGFRPQAWPHPTEPQTCRCLQRSPRTQYVPLAVACCRHRSTTRTSYRRFRLFLHRY